MGRDSEQLRTVAAIRQQLALRSLEAAPRKPDVTRRVFRDPASRILADRELPDS